MLMLFFVGQVVDSDAFAKLSLEDATRFNFDWANYSQYSNPTGHITANDDKQAESSSK